MKPHTDYPELETLAALVHDERRKVAGEMRIKKEQRAIRERIEADLAAAGVEAVTCTIPLGTFEVRRAVTRDGQRYATITAVKTDGQQRSDA